MNRSFIFLITILVSTVMIGCSSNDGTEGAVKNVDKTLVLGKTPWTSTEPPTEIATIILEDMGYEVEMEQADLGVVFEGLSTGDIDIFMDYWEPQHELYLDRNKDSAEIVSKSYEDADWGLAVPEYMEDVNDVGDLKGIEDTVNHEVIAIEQGDPAVEDVPKVIDKYDLDMEMVNSSEAAMLVEARERLKSEEPFVMFGWRPHSMFNSLDIKLLTSEKTPEYFESSTVYVVAESDLKEKAPDAYEFLSNWNIPIDDVEDMIYQIDVEEKEPKDVAQEWIDENQDKIDEMLNN